MVGGYKKYVRKGGLYSKFDFLLFPKMTFVLLFDEYEDDEDKSRGAREPIEKMRMLDLFFKKKW